MSDVTQAFALVHKRVTSADTQAVVMAAEVIALQLERIAGAVEKIAEMRYRRVGELEVIGPDAGEPPADAERSS